jgi:hypothetical protein
MKSSSKSLQMAASVDCSLNIKRELKEEKYEAHVHDLRTLLTIGKEDSKNNVLLLFILIYFMIV